MTNPLRPSIGQLVHYTSFGTPGGEYRPMCRAAVVTEVGQWVQVEITEPDSFDRSEGRPIRMVEQWWFDDAVALAVLNPTGMFFNGAGTVACRHDELPPPDKIVPGERTAHLGGTWHWPERVG